MYVDNNFELSKDKFKEVVNDMLKAPHRVGRFEDIKPETLYKTNYSQREPKVTSSEDFETRVNAALSGLNVEPPLKNGIFARGVIKFWPLRSIYF